MQGGFRAARLLFAALAAMAVLLGLAVPAQAAFPGKNGRVVMAAFRDANDPELYSIDTASGASIRLTHDTRWDDEPAVSADGAKIAWRKSSDIWVMDADGQGQRPVFESRGGASDPAFFPDGRLVASVNLSPPDAVALYAMDLDGQNRIRLTGTDIDAHQAVVSPSGKKIAFTDFGTWPLPRVMLIDSDGSNPMVIDYGSAPDFSPDGRRISYYGDEGNEGQWLADLEGHARTRVGLARPRTPAIFSPDGTSLAYSAFAVDECPAFCLWRYDLAGAYNAVLYRALPTDSPTRLSWQPIPGPRRADFKNSAQFCRAEQAFWRDQFASRYGGGANAFGKCVSSSN